MKIFIRYRLIKTKRRLTFEIQHQDMSWCGSTDDDYVTFVAKNGIEIISRSRMDIQTDRLWLLGCGPDERSGSMVFSSDEKRDKMFERFQEALREWGAMMNNGQSVDMMEIGIDNTFIIKQYGFQS